MFNGLEPSCVSQCQSARLSAANQTLTTSNKSILRHPTAFFYHSLPPQPHAHHGEALCSNSVCLCPAGADFFTPGEARQLAVRRFLLDLAMPAQRTDQLYSLHGSAEFLLVINLFPCSRLPACSGSTYPNLSKCCLIMIYSSFIYCMICSMQ